jgi:hypothetical protein
VERAADELFHNVDIDDVTEDLFFDLDNIAIEEI